MAGNSFGKVFRVTTWGESHGTGIGAVIDGCPPGITIDTERLQQEMNRRRPGQGGASSPRKEPDVVEILSGIFSDEPDALPRTTGTPISLAIFNKDAHSKSYAHIKDIYRPGHGDITYDAKYGLRDYRGGGRASARETAARVAAGAIAGQVLEQYGIRVLAYTVALGGVKITSCDLGVIEKNLYCCPDRIAAEQMEQRVQEVRSAGDTLGGIVEIRAICPAGLGEPVFDKLEAELAHGLMSIGAVKGVEFGAGFAVADMLGSENNDPITPEGFAANNAGGILAGISSGQEIVMRVAVKPIPSIGKEQQTVNRAGEPVSVKIGGRHDISAIPRVIPVCEAMVRLTLVDHLLRQNAIKLPNI
ncbi:chorismate synthase [Desulfopila aestuarii]|uniref:Chorismate synthase n=1 Tax=Desulfopila aestuarii DSM 18488 TaxID=1121416 RepID=A0A1M7Y2I8_9BACT|nr:chorismate synthase [Desulfopila aestuarii]SHO46168.1 chorismate synthase [Desulfopila aestuarii DSM 18488]